MRVGFTGAQGTGKTTLLRRFEKADLGYTVVPSTAREALTAGYRLNRDADRLSQLVTTVSRVSLEDRLYRQTGLTIGDRTPLDSLAYTAYQMSQVWSNENFDLEYYWNISQELVQNHMQKYDVIVYFPPYFSPKNDGVRDGDDQYQKDIDHWIKVLLKKFDLDYATMPMGTTDKRMKVLTNLVN